MTDILVLDLVDKGLVTNQIVLTIGYDIDNLKNKEIRERYKGEISVDYYGREVPKHAHGTVNLTQYSSSTSLIMEKVCQLFDQIINSKLLIRRINISANKVIKESEVHHKNEYVQLSLFTDYEQEEEKKKERIKERKIQEAMLNIKKKYGKNAVLKGMNFEEGATTRERNEQIGGHKA